MTSKTNAKVLHEESNNGDYRKLMSFDVPEGRLYVLESAVPGAANQRMFGVGMIFVDQAKVSAAAFKARLHRTGTGK